MSYDVIRTLLRSDKDLIKIVCYDVTKLLLNVYYDFTRILLDVARILIEFVLGFGIRILLGSPMA